MKRADDGFETVLDTVPITSSNGGEDFNTLQNGNENVNKQGIPDDNRKTTSVGKYENFKDERDAEPDHRHEHVSATNDIQISFVQSDHVSHGSTWSLGASSGSSASQFVSWYRHPKVREHWKVVVTSIVLFCLGLCLCIVGIVLEALNVELGGIFMFFVIGVLLFIPGAYHMIAVYYAVKGKRGFRFYNLPLFN